MTLVFGNGLSDFNHIAFNVILNKNIYGPFLWINCLKATELLFTTKFLEIPDTHLINFGRMKGWVDLGANQWFWTPDPWIGTGLGIQCLNYWVIAPLLFIPVYIHIRNEVWIQTTWADSRNHEYPFCLTILTTQCVMCNAKMLRCLCPLQKQTKKKILKNSLCWLRNRNHFALCWKFISKAWFLWIN